MHINKEVRVYNQVMKVIHIKRACWRILVDGALLAPHVFEAYKKMLTEEELKNIQFEETEVINKGHNVMMGIYQLTDDGSSERNVFHLNNGEYVHN